jgi:hypothetical protein
MNTADDLVLLVKGKRVVSIRDPITHTLKPVSYYKLSTTWTNLENKILALTSNHLGVVQFKKITHEVTYVGCCSGWRQMGARTLTLGNEVKCSSCVQTILCLSRGINIEEGEVI